MSEIYISKYRLVQDAKPHYVYTVDVLGHSIQQTVEKRYSAFHALHREVEIESGRKARGLHMHTSALPPHYLSQPHQHMSQRTLRKHFTTPAFPPKRVRSSQPKVLEQRRQGLEHYLQTMMKFGPSRAQIMSFLGIPDTSSGREVTKSVNHQPVFRVFLTSTHHQTRNQLPDIITEGVLSALYGH